VSLVDQADTKKLKSNPTLAAGDVQVSKDGGALANLATLPTVTPASSPLVQVDLSSTEMTADNVSVVFIDVAGAEWCDLMVNLRTVARQVDDLAFPNTSGRGIDVDATGGVEITAGQSVSVASGGIVAASFAAGAIDAAAIANGAIDAATFAAGAIDSAAIATDAIGSAELAASAAAEIAAAVWDEDATGHQTQGTFGHTVGDQVADTDSIWGLVNTNLDATISSRGSQADLTTVLNAVDTEVGAIKAKTDQLTFTNANKVDAAVLAAGDFAQAAADKVWASAARTLTALGTDIISAASVAAAAANKIADHTIRRSFANVRASADGDAFGFRSLAGAIAKLVNKWSISGTTLTVTAENDTTTVGTQTITATAGADPITTIDTD
jgi:hypothetical protein